MARTRELAGGGREIEVAPARLERFCAGFETRHGSVRRTEVRPNRLWVHAADGTTMELLPTVGGLAGHSADGLALEPLREHLAHPWRIGLLLVRAGGHSAGVAVGGHVVDSSTRRRHVQGRTAAGGWSQQRFARRRADQTRMALNQAADTAVRALLHTEMDVLVTGGDRDGVAAVLADTRLAALRPLISPRWLDVPEPRRTVLDDAAQRVDAVRAQIRPP